MVSLGRKRPRSRRTAWRTLPRALVLCAAVLVACAAGVAGSTTTDVPITVEGAMEHEDTGGAATGAGGAGAGVDEPRRAATDGGEAGDSLPDVVVAAHLPIGDSNQPLIGEDEMTEFRNHPTHDEESGRRLNQAEAEVVGKRTKYLAIMGKRFPLDLTGGWAGVFAIVSMCNMTHSMPSSIRR